jgi:DNA modification methylase
MILDATAGNRTMWLWKECPHIIHIDMDKELQIKPDMICDNTQTPFKDKTFDTIFYDPPHNWGTAIHYFSFRNSKEREKVFPHSEGVPTYYGWDKYKTKDALLNHMNKASKEFYRILKDDGLLWIKWNEMAIPLRTVLIIFKQWIELMRLYVNDPTHTAGNAQTYWILMCKEKGEGKQLTLLDANLTKNSPQPSL